MSEEIAGIRYARALFELSEKERLLSETDTTLSSLADTAAGHPEIMAIVRSPILKESEKISLVEKIIPADSPALLKDFLRVLIEKKRFPLLARIRKEFHRLFEKRQGILEVEVVSTAPFSKDLQVRLQKMLSSKLRSEVRLIPKTDAALIGGFLLRFNGREIDCSFKNRFHEIEQQLLTSN